MSHDWKDAYEAQMGTWRWCRSDSGSQWRTDHWSMTMEMLSNPHTRALASSLYAAEEYKLLSGDPYYVSREFCEVVEAASQTFAPEPLLQTDLLTDYGFCYFATPHRMPDKYDVMVSLAAFSWGPISASTTESFDRFQSHVIDGEELAPGAVEVNYNDIELEKQVGVALTLYAVPREERWEPEWGPMPPVVPIHHTPWYFHMDFEGNEFDEEGNRTGVEKWWQVIQTTLRLMQQKIGHRQNTRPDRATRRRGIARGFHEREVVVVKLRRESGDHIRHEPESEANYSHRFIVSGHWRNQWYASGQVHRQIWISPYVKGPEDQPLVVRPRRVFNVVR